MLISHKVGPFASCCQSGKKIVNDGFQSNLNQLIWQRAARRCYFKREFVELFAVLPDFSFFNIPKREKIYQTNPKYTK
jgi:hypothetical protein